MKRLFLVLTALIIAFPAFADSVQTYYVADKQIKISIPKGWKDKTKKELDENVMTVFFAPAQGESIRMWITAIAAKTDEPDAVKDILEKTLQGIRPQAVEKEFPFVPLDGKSVHGLYFSATDRAPAKGEYKFLTEGALAVDGSNIRVVFTILSNDGQQTAARQGLDMIKTIALAQ